MKQDAGFCYLPFLHRMQLLTIAAFPPQELRGNLMGRGPSVHVSIAGPALEGVYGGRTSPCLEEGLGTLSCPETLQGGAECLLAADWVHSEQ